MPDFAKIYVSKFENWVENENKVMGNELESHLQRKLPSDILLVRRTKVLLKNPIQLSYN